MKIRNILLGLAFFASGTANAATVFAPTDGDVNFLLGDLLGGQLAIFDDSDQTYVGLSLDVQIGDIVGFAGPNGLGDHTATNTTTNLTLNLTGSDNFILGYNDGNGWIADASATAIGANSYSVTFASGANVIEVDVQIIPAAIPVPAAVWLFGSGLLGVVGIARRRKAA